jgi:hypothetical protein
MLSRLSRRHGQETQGPSPSQQALTPDKTTEAVNPSDVERMDGREDPAGRPAGPEISKSFYIQIAIDPPTATWVDEIRSPFWHNAPRQHHSNGLKSDAGLNKTGPIRQQDYST